MVTVHTPRPLHAAIKTRLEAQISGKDIGLGRAADDNGAAFTDPPYAVIHPLPALGGEGSIDDPWQVERMLFQVTYVGDDMTEAQWMQEQVRTALLGWAPTVSGFTPQPIEMDLPNLIGDTDEDGPVYTLADRFLVYVS